MTTPYDIDALPSFPTTWTAPESCFASTRYFRVLLGGGYFSNLYGTPTPVLTGNWPTGDCWPPSSTPRIPYVTDGGCPAGYTRACATAGPDYNGKPMSTVTCCPSIANNAFSFMCRGHEYGCHATATSGAVWTGVITDIGLDTPTEQPITRTPNAKEGLEAWGIKLISIAPTTTAASATETTSTSTIPTPTSDGTNTESSGGGLSTGAIVGIALGAVAIVVLAVIAFLFYRRWHKRQPVTDMTATVPHSYYPPQTAAGAAAAAEQKPEVYQLDADPPAQMLYTADQHRGGTPRWEMQG